MKTKTKFVAGKVPLVLTCLCFAITSRADLLLFDAHPPAPGVQDAYGPGSEYVESGFRLTTTSTPGHHGAIRRVNPEGIGVLPDNGTVHFGATYYAHPLLDRPDGALFSLAQIDLAHYSRYVLRDEVAFLGNKADGTTVSVSFILASCFDPAFHTFQFDDSWTDLQSVSFLTNGIAWDNLMVSVVPEPSCPNLILGGLLLGACLWRRVT